MMYDLHGNPLKDEETVRDGLYDINGVRISTDTTPQYEGVYNVTPQTYAEITLETSGKRMKDDVTVKQIPQFAVSNTQGGTTLIIGEENSNGN